MDICINGLVQCPYNPAHMIRPERMQFHLAKCAKSNQSKVIKKICPFNSVHHVDAAELDNHVKMCPDRLAFDAFKYAMSNQQEIVPDVSPINPIASGIEEDWGSSDSPSYNPQEYLEQNRNIIKPLRGVQPSVKRAHRMEQRRNYTEK